jgi:outer membrane protein assembly factor BamE
MKKIITITILLISCTLMGCVYVPDVQQGNIIDKSAAQKLHTGMTKDQVRELLGDPVLTNCFDENYWTYYYTMQKNGGKIKEQYLNLYFTNNRLIKIDGRLQQ